MVVSGEVIGTKIGGSAQQQPPAVNDQNLPKQPPQ
jgi:hypothetical protein